MGATDYFAAIEHYRKFRIDHAYIGYQATHKDYDGPEDDRAFHANTVEELREEIDEYWLENCDECDGEGVCDNCGGAS